MSKARLVITAVLVEGRSQCEVARSYGVSQPWISRLVARYRTEGEAAFQAHSRRPKSSPDATAPAVVDLVLQVRKELAQQGLDAGPHTVCWHLEHHHKVRVSPATVHRILTRHGQVRPEPKKRPRRFDGECWISCSRSLELILPPFRLPGPSKVGCRSTPSPLRTTSFHPERPSRAPIASRSPQIILRRWD